MHSNSLKQIEQVKPEIGLSSALPARSTVGRTHLLQLLLISGLVFFGTTYISGGVMPTGDEPHYLVISQTLLHYHSLDVSLDYAHQDYKAFYHGTLEPVLHSSLNKWGQVLPLHSIGAPVLWLIPFALAGKFGTLLFMSLLSMLMVVCIYLLLVSLDIRRNYAFLVSLALALASPIWVYSHRNFVEPVAALICVYIVQVLFKKERLRTLDLIGTSLVLGILPWIHIRFALCELVLACFLLARVYQDHRLSQIKSYLAALLPVFGMFLLFEAYNFFVWGSLNPAINQANSGEMPFDTTPWRGLFGLFFDQEYGLLTNFPIFLFLLPGFLLACKRKFLRYNLLFLCLFVPYIMIVASFHNWDGAISPPARFVMVMVPLCAFYLALVLQEAHSWFVNGLFLLFMGVSMLYEGVSLTINGGWINWEDGHSRPLSIVAQALHLPLNAGVPAVFPYHKIFFPDQLWPTVGWSILLAVLTLAVLLLATRRRTATPVEHAQPANL